MMMYADTCPQVKHYVRPISCQTADLLRQILSIFQITNETFYSVRRAIIDCFTGAFVNNNRVAQSFG